MTSWMPAVLALAARLADGEITEAEYHRLYAELYEKGYA